MNGWPIVGWATLGVLAIVATILGVVGGDEAGIKAKGNRQKSETSAFCLLP